MRLVHELDVRDLLANSLVLLGLSLILLLLMNASVGTLAFAVAIAAGSLMIRRGNAAGRRPAPVGRLLGRLPPRKKEPDEKPECDTPTHGIAEAILGNIADGVCVTNITGEMTFMNSAARQLFGTDLTKIPMDEGYEDWVVKQGWYCPDQVTPFPKGKLPFSLACRGESTHDVDIYVRSPRVCGAGKYLQLTGNPLMNGDGQVKGGVVTARDATDRKLAEQEAQHSQELFRTAFNASPAAMAISSIEDGRFIDANDSFLELLGYTRAELIGHTTFELQLWPDLNQRNRLAIMLRNAGSIRDIDVQIRTKVGEVRDFLSSFELIYWRGKECVLGMATDITQRKEYERNLREAKRAADTANRSKSEFLGNMSHEMRTPLSAIFGYLEMLAQSINGPSHGDQQSQLRYIHRVGHNVTNLLQLIDDILDLTKIEAGRLEAERIAFSLLSALATTLLQLRTQARNKGLNFEIYFDGPIPEQIESDPHRLRQIINNVVGNAIKFTDKGQICLTIRLSRPQEQDTSRPVLQFMVSDTGCGMTNKQQTKVFAPFCQADNSITRRYGGTGLGLTLSRKLTRELGGDLVIKSSVPGKGTTFEFAVDPGTLDGIQLHENIDLEAYEVPVASESTTPKNRATLKQKRILLVEDGSDNQEVIAFFLKSAGADVTVADNGAQGIRAAKSQTFDLILMDVQMPVLGGQQATTVLRNEGYSVPIIALTAAAMSGERERYLQSGFDDYLSKPFKPDALIRTIQMHLAGRATKELASHVEMGDEQQMDSNSDQTLTPLHSIYANDPRVGPVIKGFVKRLPLRVQALSEALSRNDWKELANLAHQLKGAAGGYGYPDLTNLAREIEKRAVSPSPSDKEEVSSLVDEFQLLCDRAARAIS